MTRSFMLLALALAVSSPVGAAEAAVSDRDAVRAVLSAYRAAMTARDVEALAKTVDPALLVVEGTHLNRGWADYRDNHIGPEMKGWSSYSLSGASTQALEVSGDLAYAVETATHAVAEAGKTAVLDGAETFVLVRGKDGWRIRLVHFSAKRRAPPGAKR